MGQGVVHACTFLVVVCKRAASVQTADASTPNGHLVRDEHAQLGVVRLAPFRDLKDLGVDLARPQTQMAVGAIVRADECLKQQA